MKVGLVLEGGGMRGAYTGGCLKWFIENDVDFDHKCAISAAALLLVYFETKDVVALENLVKELPKKTNVGVRPFLREGQFVGYKRMIYQICEKENPLDFKKLANSHGLSEISVYNADQDKQIWLNQKEITYPYLHASNMLPVSGRGVKINGELHYDGGVKSMMPVFRSVEKNCDKILFVTTKPKSYIRKQNGKILQFVMNILYRKYPKMLQAINDRVNVYLTEIKKVDEIVESGNGLLLRPSRDIDVKRLSATKESIDELFDLGYQDCEDRKDDIFKLIGKK